MIARAAIQSEKQNGRLLKLAEKLENTLTCIYCRKELHLSRRSKNNNSFDPQQVSLDRIDNGDIIGCNTCQWICRGCNLHKSDMSDGLYRIYLDSRNEEIKEELKKFLDTWNNRPQLSEFQRQYINNVVDKLSALKESNGFRGMSNPLDLVRKTILDQSFSIMHG